jgi:siroheme synthase
MMFQIIVGLAAVMAASAFVGVKTTTRDSKAIVMAAEKSKSLPFLPQPPNIVGMAGDVGKTKDTVIIYSAPFISQVIVIFLSSTLLQSYPLQDLIP